MPCLIVLFACFFPRLVILLLAFLTNYMSTAYHTLLWPVLGFFFMPYTTLGYAFAMHQGSGTVTGPYIVLLVICVLVDLGVWGGGGREQVRRRKVAVVER